jgi:hypothetical protein
MAQTSAPHPPQVAASPGLSPAGSIALGDQARAVFGQVMGLVALTLGLFGGEGD